MSISLLLSKNSQLSGEKEEIFFIKPIVHINNWTFDIPPLSRYKSI